MKKACLTLRESHGQLTTPIAPERPSQSRPNCGRLIEVQLNLQAAADLPGRLALAALLVGAFALAFMPGRSLDSRIIEFGGNNEETRIDSRLRPVPHVGGQALDNRRGRSRVHNHSLRRPQSRFRNVRP